MQLKEKISSVYAGKLNPTIEELDIPKEKLATCFDCYHCTTKNAPRAKTKCCDYHPHLPNYMVGAILADMDQDLVEGKNRIQKRIAQKYGVTPYGIIAPYAHQLLFNQTRKAKKWPEKINIENLLCPFSHQGLCSIWPYRSEVCASFHCVSNGGKAGKKFWDILYRYLIKIEQAISLYILRELEYPVSKLRVKRITPEELQLDDKEGNLNAKFYDYLWDRWKGGEVDFYKLAYQVFKSIDKDNFKRIMGTEGHLLEDKLIFQSRAFHKDLIPDLLLFDKERVQFSYSKDNMPIVNCIELSPIQLELLSNFDGATPSNEVIRMFMVMYVPITKLIKPMIKAGILQELPTPITTL